MNEILTLVANGPGIGDSAVLSAVTQHLTEQKPGSYIKVVCNHPELFFNNPTVNEVVLGNVGGSYASFPELHNQASIQEHNIQFMCRKFGLIPPPIEKIRPYIYLSENEKYEGNLYGKLYITIHIKAGQWTQNKDWYYDRWNRLTKMLRDYFDIQIVQIGGLSDPKLDSVSEYLFGKDLRKVCSYLFFSALHICPVSGSMHLATGVGTNCVVIYGGRENEKVTGYTQNINIRTRPACSPCWYVEPCPYGTPFNFSNIQELQKPCMDEITVDNVFEIIKEKLIHHAT